MRLFVYVYVFLVTKCSSLSSTKSIFDRLVPTAKTPATTSIDAESTKSQVAFVPIKDIQTANLEEGLTDLIKADGIKPLSGTKVEPYQENKPSSEVQPKNKPSSEVRSKNETSSKVRPKNKASSEVQPKNKTSSKVRPKKQKKNELARRMRRYFDEFHPEPEGLFMKYYREEQKEQDYVQCHKIFTPFWRGLKVHPKNHRNVKMYYPNDYLCERFIQILNMNMTMFGEEDLHGVMQVIRKMKLRLFFWHHNAIKVLLNTIIEGKSHNFYTLRKGVKQVLKTLRVKYSNTTQLLAAALIYRPPCFKQHIAGSTLAVKRPILQTSYDTTTTSCKSTTPPEHFGHTHGAEYDLPSVVVVQGSPNNLDDIKRVIRNRDENEEQYGAEQEYIAGDIAGVGENQDVNVEYMEGDQEKTDYILPSLKELDDREQKDLNKHEYSDLDGDEVIRAKVNQYDMEEVGNYDHMELPSKETRDSIALQQYVETKVGQNDEENLENIHYHDELNEPNPEYEDNTDTIAAKNQDEIKGIGKVGDEKIYNEAEEYIENIFAGLDTK